MAKKYLDDAGVLYFWGKLKDYFQVKLVSGTNIKTVNNTSILGSGNISIAGVDLSSYIVAEQESAFSASVGGSTYADITHTYTKSGYYPLGIIGWSITGTQSTMCFITRCYLSSTSSGSCTATFRIRNTATTDASPNVVITILWLKES